MTSCRLWQLSFVDGGVERVPYCCTPQFSRLGLRRHVQQWIVNGMYSDLLAVRAAAVAFDHAAPVTDMGLHMSLLYDALGQRIEPARVRRVFS